MEKATLSREQERRLKAWRALPGPRAAPLHEQRLVVVDLESTGLNPSRDRPLSVGAVGVEHARVRLDQPFLRHLRQDTRSADGSAVLIHGITPAQADQGMAPADALLDFLEFAGKSPLLAYHAPFDRELLSSAIHRNFGVRLEMHWLDLAWLLPALFPEAKKVRAPLDAWLDYFHLDVPDRHRADVDALMTAELFLICLARVRSRGLAQFKDVAELARLHALRDLQGSGA